MLEADQLADAATLLGRPFSVAGRVVYGKRLGRTLDVPTANIGLGRYRSPVRGVYVTDVYLPSSGQRRQAVANVGVRPTVDGDPKPLLEVHLLDFSSELYGQWLCVEFRHKLRNEKKFNSLDELKQQIQQDIQAARQYFANAE